MVYPKAQSLVLFFFLIYINYIHNNINSDIKLFADDNTLLYSNPNSVITQCILFDDLNQIDLWAKQWFVKFNCNESKVLTINGPPSTPKLLSLNNETLEDINCYRYVEMTFTKTLICAKANELVIIL